jgi:hypothetical protein
MTGKTSDISHICEFEWYEWLMYHEDKGFPEDKAKLGRYLGPTEPGIGSVMSYYVLQSNGEVVTKRTIRKLTPTCVYTGERSRYSFVSHVSIFKKAHLDLQKAGNEPGGRTKVRKFLQSVYR